MVTVDTRDDMITVAVMGELMLDDMHEFEHIVEQELHQYEHVDVLLDLGNMTGFSIDAAWEDIVFIRSHNRAFRRIAVVTSDQWLAWLAWLNGAFTGAEVQTFPQRSDAEYWLSSAA